MSSVWPRLLSFTCLVLSGLGEDDQTRGAGQCERPAGEGMIPADRWHYSAGDSLTVQCETGYRPSHEKITCTRGQTNDTWDHSPRCIGQCERPAGGQITPGHRRYYNAGESLTVKCETEYRPSRKAINCIAGQTKDTWDHSPWCIGRCKRPAGERMIQRDRQYYSAGETLTVKCATGYRPSHEKMTCTRGQTNDTWDHSAWCIARCKKPENTAIYTISGEKSYYDVGDSVSVQCMTGYRPLHEKITCVTGQTEDEWENTPQCKARCKKPENTAIYTISGEKSYYDVGDSVSVQCMTGYRPLHEKITCVTGQTEDKWENTPQCKAQCKTPQDTDKYTIYGDKDSYDVGEYVTVQCKTGYRAVYGGIKCYSHDQWDPFPWCVERCKEPSISNLETFTPYREYYYQNEEVTLQCEPGYYPSSYTIRCTNNGERDVWTPTAVCIERCKKPSVSNLKTFTPYREYYSRNDEVRLQCEPGYYPSSYTIRCMNNGERDVWTPTAVCIERCKKPSISNLETVTPYKEYYSRNEDVRFQCEPGFYPSPYRIRCTNNGERDVWTPTAVCIEVKVTKKSVTPTSISLSLVCTPVQCENNWSSSISSCMHHGLVYKGCKDGTGNVTFSNLDPVTEYKIITYNTRPSWLTLQTLYITTAESAPAAPDIVKTPSMEDGTVVWKLSNKQGNITGFELNIVAWRDYNSSFSMNITEWFPPNITQYKMNLQHGTNYTFHLKGFTSAGGGEYRNIHMETPIGDPPVPTVVKKDLTLQLQPVSDANGPISHYEIIIFSEPESNTSDCLRVTRTHYNSTPTPYTAALLPAHNLTESITLGDGQRYGGFYNAPLIPNREYTVYVRVTSKWKEDKSSCVFLDFFTAKDPISGAAPVIAGSVAALLLLLLLLVLAVLWRTGFYRKLKKTEEIPLKSGLGKKKDIPVENLLDVVKTLRYKEMFENEEVDEENANILPIGRYLEYKDLPSGLLHPCKISQSEENRIKNRYKKVVPYDDSRVILRSSPSGSDYINASYINGYRAPKSYIATQGPLPETVADFWSMVWQESSSVIVMLTSLEEQNKVKCERYWPEQTQTYGDITVSLEKVVQTGAVITRSFSLKKAQSTVQMTVEQLHYLEWPDHGVPTKPSGLVQLVEQMNKSNTPGSGPVIVHCSAGIGRTGTFMALDILLKMERAVKKVNVFGCVRQLRKSRVNMVQNKEQYVFLYDILLEALLCGMTSVPVPDIERHLSHMTRRDPRTHMDGYDREFQALEEITQLYQIYPCKEAKKPENQKKNRNSRILPGDHSGPILLSALTRDGAPGYINAVFVNSNCLEDDVIATQLPMEETVGDFWSLVWDYKCTSVVMMHQARDLRQIGSRFFPDRGESHYGGFSVTATVKKSEKGYGWRSLSLRRSNEVSDSTLEVTLWELDSWPPDQDLPQDPSALIAVIGEVEKCHQLMADSHILVTCGDGASRSGLFCTGLIVCDQIRSDGVVDVSQAVQALRRRRWQFIPSKEQYSFCYVMARRYLDSFETYGNFK